MDEILVLNMNGPHLITCGVCGNEDDHSHPSDRRCIPFYNGAPTSSISEHDCYRFVCARCYLRWLDADEKVVQ